jgi:hypothetical protein
MLRQKEHYFLKTNAHVANEKLYFVKGLETMLQQVVKGVKLVNMKKKIMQFALLFHLLNRGCLMNEYTTIVTTHLGFYKRLIK